MRRHAQPAVQEQFDFTAARTRASVHASLKALGVEYIDLVQVRARQ